MIEPSTEHLIANIFMCMQKNQMQEAQNVSGIVVWCNMCSSGQVANVKRFESALVIL